MRGGGKCSGAASTSMQCCKLNRRLPTIMKVSHVGIIKVTHVGCAHDVLPTRSRYYYQTKIYNPSTSNADICHIFLPLCHAIRRQLLYWLRA